MALASKEQQYWEEEEEAVEVGLKRRHENLRQEMEETAATATVDGKDDATTFASGIESTFFLTAITSTMPPLINNTEILTELPITQPPLKTSFPEPDIQVNSSHVNGTASNGSITTMQESRHHYTDMYLEPTFQKQPTQKFFCPKCNTCITKVVLRDSNWQPSPSPVEPEPAVIPGDRQPTRCEACLSFLIPVGLWFKTCIGVDGNVKDSTVGGSRITVAPVPPQPGGRDNLEILKSIVYGGLAESITSLSVVTSAAGASVSSSKIIAMALANFIGGLFVIIHNIWDLKKQVDRYQKLLGKTEHFAVHTTFVLLSFLVFGIEPPLVYGFSFRDSDNIDYKLAVVAGASFLCISLLALGEAHIQKPSSYRAYLKTLVNYLVIAFAASGISYVAGDLIAKLLDKLGLFKSESEAAFFLPFNDASEVNPTWSSY